MDNKKKHKMTENLSTPDYLEEVQAARSILGIDKPRYIKADETLDEAIEREKASNDRDIDDWREVLAKHRNEFNLLANELREPIENHRWDSVIGDDISGHWVAVFVHRLMKLYAQENGLNVPTITFVAPKSNSQYTGFQEKRSKRKRERTMGKLLKHRQERLGHSVLVVTEYIAGGKHVKKIAKALPRGTHYDVASLAISGHAWGQESGAVPNHPYARLESDPWVFFGSSNASTPSSLYAAMLSHTVGREKNNSLPIAIRDDVSFRPKVVQGIRESTIQLADEIYNEVFHGKESEKAA